ncbi:hypothetical protein RRG08_053476 [Elysia crispata]|uniref:Uncharacterized protein n=1 Tax=Elysia crispata TaxID=231223 RepID=A0AAE1DRJ4_9GAST|nr:hypothetical protein RRG08_053476 [Elysia crispata]
MSSYYTNILPPPVAMSPSTLNGCGGVGGGGGGDDRDGVMSGVVDDGSGMMGLDSTAIYGHHVAGKFDNIYSMASPILGQSAGALTSGGVPGGTGHYEDCSPSYSPSYLRYSSSSSTSSVAFDSRGENRTPLGSEVGMITSVKQMEQHHPQQQHQQHQQQQQHLQHQQLPPPLTHHGALIHHHQQQHQSLQHHQQNNNNNHAHLQHPHHQQGMHQPSPHTNHDLEINTNSNNNNNGHISRHHQHGNSNNSSNQIHLNNINNNSGNNSNNSSSNNNHELSQDLHPNHLHHQQQQQQPQQQPAHINPLHSHNQPPQTLEHLHSLPQQHPLEAQPHHIHHHQEQQQLPLQQQHPQHPHHHHHHMDSLTPPMAHQYPGYPMSGLHHPGNPDLYYDNRMMDCKGIPPEMCTSPHMGSYYYSQQSMPDPSGSPNGYNPACMPGMGSPNMPVYPWMRQANGGKCVISGYFGRLRVSEMGKKNMIFSLL